MSDAIFEFFAPLVRQGPGSREATLRALAELGPLPARPRVTDFGCGSGAATRVLAEALPDARITAIDLSDVLLDRLRANDPDHRITTRQASMLDPGEPASLDLAWSEGAIYSVGVEPALRAWAPQLRPRGLAVFSDLVWFEPESTRPREAVEFWAKEGLTVVDESGMRERIAGLGHRVRFDVRLEAQAWFDYYAAIEARCAAPSSDPAMRELIAGLEAEIALWRQFGASYGYTFFGVEIV
jgi:SAM-dependent methyltransferase